MRWWAGLIACGALLAPASGAAVQPITGTYLDTGGYVEITVAPCGNAMCGTITRIVMAKPGGSRFDSNNNDPTLRDRPILGLTILQDLRWNDGAWRGQVYNPEDGGTYRATVRPGAGNSLEVKGCFSIICRTRNWPSAG